MINLNKNQTCLCISNGFREVEINEVELEQILMGYYIKTKSKNESKKVMEIYEMLTLDKQSFKNQLDEYQIFLEFNVVNEAFKEIDSVRIEYLKYAFEHNNYKDTFILSKTNKVKEAAKLIDMNINAVLSDQLYDTKILSKEQISLKAKSLLDYSINSDKERIQQLTNVNEYGLIKK
jgi:predicted component of type VI protein secretion system